MEAYGMNNMVIVSWFVTVFLANLTVFSVLMYRVQFKKKSRCLVLLSSLYYMMYSMTIAIFSSTINLKTFRERFCSHVMGSLCLAIILGNVFCVLGVSLERFTYIVYALHYKRIITSTRMMLFTILLFSLTLSYMAASMAGALKFRPVQFNKTIICTVDDRSFPSQVVSYVSLLIYLLAFFLVPSLWLKIHFLRNNIKRVCSIQSKLPHRGQQRREASKKLEDQLQPLQKGIPSPRSIIARNLALSKLKNVYQKSPDIVPCERTPATRRSALSVKRQKNASQASFLSTTKSSKHTIKIFLVSFVVLKIQYVCLFPPFIQKIGESDNLPLVVLISFADALFGCLLLVAADVELKQMFFRFIRLCCIDNSSNSNVLFRT